MELASIAMGKTSFVESAAQILDEAARIVRSVACLPPAPAPGTTVNLEVQALDSKTISDTTSSLIASAVYRALQTGHPLSNEIRNLAEPT